MAQQQVQPVSRVIEMVSEERILVRRFYEEIINNARFEKLGEILSAEIIWHDPLLPTGEIRGIENFKNALRMFRSAIPDLHITIEDQIQENDKVVTRSTIDGTQRGELMQIPPTGKKMKITGISVMPFEHGRAVEEWIEEDRLGLMRQLGVMS
jgi:steroid delta-isomerase-like uncharacterized protein